jgi:glucosamine kinase
MAFFCLDLGGTKSTGAVFAVDGAELGFASGPAGAVSLGVPVTLQAVRGIWSAIGPVATADQTDVVIGLAGIGLRDRVAQVIAGLCEFRSVRCVSDGYGALLDATGANPGALIMVGTGVVGMRLNPDGTCLTASGWGFPAGDLGGGAWIGIRATAELTRWLDGIRSSMMTANLAHELMAVTGSSAQSIMTWLTTSQAKDYARLAPIIAASTTGFATGLMAGAALEIGSVGGVLQPDGRGTIYLSGGLGEALLPHCRAEHPYFDWQYRRVKPLQGLFLMASGQAPDERLAPRPGLGRPDYQD